VATVRKEPERRKVRLGQKVKNAMDIVVERDPFTSWS